jgi:hypothetical protein
MVVWLVLFGSSLFAVEFNTIRSNMESMTSAQWGEYTKSLVGQKVEWEGWVTDVKAEWFTGKYKLLIDMDPPNTVSVHDIFINGVAKENALLLTIKQKIKFTGYIRLVMNVLGSCSVSLGLTPPAPIK